MDFGDFIVFILFLIFIFAPFLKRIKKAKVQNTDKSKQSGFGILGKIREALEEAARQAEQTRTTEASGERMRSSEGHESPFDRPGEDDVDQSFWDEIDDREDEEFYPGDADAKVLETIEPAKEHHRKASNRSETRGMKSIGQGSTQRRCYRSGSIHLPARARGLQKAVIWSEILGKPVALRDSDSSCRY